ncbi:sensor domain-containing protein [Modestobacter sp. VKM Ac-2986]|uniref:sensor histidine kinase n=1 Tax=Modestobacter sp. VKM Ac-2986 TaxID=3004140 RepID=UPI0022AAFFE3|nr:sensor histidine kinase [Modestobacter sp. VKM Ac-2986]MCZ2828585.1 sensor domain-containing protein [Modestobacter sp. VKM Ac-2986]
MTTPTTRTGQRARWRQTGVDAAHVLLGFPLALVAFVVVVVGLALGAGLLIVWIGLPVLVGTLFVARGLATVERRRLPAVLGRPLPRPVYRPVDPTQGLPQRLVAPMREPQYWLDALHGVLHLVVALPAFVVVVTWGAGVLGGLSYGAWGWALPEGPDSRDLPELLGLGEGLGVRIAANAVLGLFFLVTLPPVTRAMALLEAQLGRALLTSRAGTQAELGRLAEGRDAAVAAEAVALRQLERDIHDGPQQRLVRLSMDLHRARRMIDTDPEGARATLAEAAEQTRETLEELRALSRGIAPPVLADRGLTAALAAIAARSPVAVDLAVSLPLGQRLPPVVENTAYFLVSEALANVAKHSTATLARVAVDLEDGLLRVEVEDDGAGGAVLAPGHGLAGLTDRLRAVDGVLTVDSPRGGPTRLIGEVPCR